jgi:solute carrier family 8 (sodium/calcium exchanger)
MAAELFGCVLNIKASVNAVTIVALGTSLPDTFASMIAATGEPYADAAIGNVTGSNSVNVFLGLGLPWVIALIWEQSNPNGNGKYFVPAGALGFSVVVFVICAILCISVLLLRRCIIGGELGGSPNGRIGTAIFMFFLWLVYIVMCICNAYGIGGMDKLTFGVDINIANKCNPNNRG